MEMGETNFPTLTAFLVNPFGSDIQLGLKYVLYSTPDPVGKKIRFKILGHSVRILF